MAALLAAAEAPERVAGLMLVDTHAEPDTADRRAARERQATVARDGGFVRLVAEELKPAYFADAEAHGPERTLVARMAAAQGPGRFERHVRALIDRPDLAAAARRVRVPTEVVVGNGNRSRPRTPRGR